MSDTMATQLSTLDIAPPATLKEFHLFQMLPNELRLKIYATALSTPRTLTITCSRPPFKRGEPRRTAQSFRCNLPPPALLHVSQESRYEALAVYKPHFRTAKSNDTYISARGHIYVSFAQDTLKFEDTILVYLAETELQGIQSLILDVKDCGYFGHFNMDVVKRMRRLKDLEMWGEKRDGYSWARGDAYLNVLLQDFEAAREMDPGWVCPNVRVYNKQSGKQVANIEGGALIPGWVEE